MTRAAWYAFLAALVIGAIGGTAYLMTISGPDPVAIEQPDPPLPTKIEL